MYPLSLSLSSSDRLNLNHRQHTEHSPGGFSSAFSFVGNFSSPRLGFRRQFQLRIIDSWVCVLICACLLVIVVKLASSVHVSWLISFWVFFFYACFRFLLTFYPMGLGGLISFLLRVRKMGISWLIIYGVNFFWFQFLLSIMNLASNNDLTYAGLFISPQISVGETYA